MRMNCNLFCNDVQAQMDFYAAVLGWPERVEERSAIYRSLALPGGDLGFNARPAYALLELAERMPGDGHKPVTAFPTFTVDTPTEVDVLTKRAVQLGASLLKAPYATYYGNWQAVLADPEGHAFRINALALPPGITAPSSEF